MKKSRKILYIVMVAIMIGSFSFRTYATEEDNGDINIRIQSLKDRQFDSQALTDGYDIEILTPTSSYYNREIIKQKYKEMDELEGSLTMNNSSKLDKKTQIVSEVVEYNIFSNGYIAKNKNELKEVKQIGKIHFLCWIVLCILGGFFMARIWQRIRKRRNRDVYYDNSTDKR